MHTWYERLRKNLSRHKRRQSRRPGVYDIMESPMIRALTVSENGDPQSVVQLVNSAKTEDALQVARQVQKADEFVRANAGNRLTQIAGQMQFLQEEAKKVLLKTKEDASLHHAACNFVKKPGSVYFLYRRPCGRTYFSILSPQEWGPSCPHTFLNAYRLECDQSFTKMEDLQKRDAENSLIEKLLSKHLAITDSSFHVNDIIADEE